MKNVTLLRLNIREVLAANCKHDVKPTHGACEDCENLEDAIVEAVQSWRMRAYGESKGKI